MVTSQNNYNWYYQMHSRYVRFQKNRLPDRSFLDWFVSFVEREASFNCFNCWLSKAGTNPEFSVPNYNLS